MAVLFGGGKEDRRKGLFSINVNYTPTHGSVFSSARCVTGAFQLAGAVYVESSHTISADVRFIREAFKMGKI